jgi:hypothetical protein
MERELNKRKQRTKETLSALSLTRLNPTLQTHWHIKQATCCQGAYLGSYRALIMKSAHSAYSGMILIEIRKGQLYFWMRLIGPWTVMLLYHL